jgi:hypothetical protein
VGNPDNSIESCAGKRRQDIYLYPFDHGRPIPCPSIGHPDELVAWAVRMHGRALSLTNGEILVLLPSPDGWWGARVCRWGPA